MLNPLEKQTILASLRNGLGLTHVCNGLHLHPQEVSTEIRNDEAFELECQKQAIAGYQAIVIEINNSMSKRAWDKWRTNRQYLDTFITSVNLWESLSTPKDFDFSRFTIALKKCKTLPETATAMGLTEAELYEKIYEDSRLVEYLMQINFPI